MDAKDGVWPREERRQFRGRGRGSGRPGETVERASQPTAHSPREREAKSGDLFLLVGSHRHDGWIIGCPPLHRVAPSSRADGW